jgi:hypothetical protein
MAHLDSGKVIDYSQAVLRHPRPQQFGVRNPHTVILLSTEARRSALGTSLRV